VLSDRFEGARPHRCLQHSASNVGDRGSGTGFRAIAKTTCKWIAFASPPLFSELIDVHLEGLERANQSSLVDYIRNSGHHVVHEGGRWTAPWQSSFFDVAPGRSCSLSNVVEARWKVLGVTSPALKKAALAEAIRHTETSIRTRANDTVDLAIEHAPTGDMRHKPTLLRGQGLWQPKRDI